MPVHIPVKDLPTEGLEEMAVFQFGDTTVIQWVPF